MSHRYLLDTNILAELARNPGGVAARRIAAVGESTICTSAIVACEVHYGLAKRSSPRLTERMSEVLEAIDILTDLPADIGIHYGSIRTHLESAGATIGPNDLLIAAHARAADLTVVTGNDREFRRVPDLRVENWLAA